MKTRLTATSIRPASGRALAHVTMCGGFGRSSSNLNQHPRSQSMPATLWLQGYEDQVQPGGGSA